MNGSVSKFIIFAFTLSIFAGSLRCAQAQASEHAHEHPAPEKLGTVDFATSCSPANQKAFERAVALLHSFTYYASEKAFRDLIEKEPSCAMAHWGLAMSYVHPLWEPHLTPEETVRGRAALEKAKRLDTSERERGFIDALALLYENADQSSFSKRAEAYAQAMHALAERNPNDVECQVFYALALITTASPTDKTHAREKKAVDILEPLFKKYPEHPGIAHYLIHACDNAEMAKRAVAAARVYSQVAPSAPHALHMPSHIYTRLGMWEESVASNAASRKAAHEHGDIGEELHAMDYLTYAYLQLGRNAEAERVVDDVRAMEKLDSGIFKIGYAASAMPVRCAVERRRWTDAAQLVPIAGTQPQVAAITRWARALGLARGGQAGAARKEVEKLRDDYEKLRAAGDDYWATQVKVQLDEAQAWIAFAEKRNEEAVQLMRRAADEEDAVEKRPVTPGAIIPAREQLGDLLLEIGDAQSALKEFEAALMQTPQRRGALMGKERALAKSSRR